MQQQNEVAEERNNKFRDRIKILPNLKTEIIKTKNKRSLQTCETRTKKITLCHQNPGRREERTENVLEEIMAKHKPTDTRKLS